jgi:hypothetical protein
MGMPIDPPAGEEAQAPAVDLAAWASGEIEYPFAEVQRKIDDLVLAEVDTFIKKRFPLMVTNPKEAIAFLVQEGLIAEADVRTDLEDADADEALED